MNDAYNDLVDKAVAVMHRNDAGDWTRAAPNLYPHQWSWDSAFIAIGWGHIDTHRAMRELDRLFEAQWRNGKIPHIVFDPDSTEATYFPGPGRWECPTLCNDAPRPPIQTSGICQPPVHALAAHRIWTTSRVRNGHDADMAEKWLGVVYPKLLAWHRYLHTARDPEESGLVSIFHPWESGCDNSPRWDFVMGRLVVGHMPAYTRYDIGHVGDPSQRPSDTEYDYYVWLVEEMKRAGYDDSRIYESHPFIVKDVLFSAILVAANEALLEIARVVGALDDDEPLISEWIERGRSGLEEHSTGGGTFACDYDVNLGHRLEADTVAAILAPLVAGGIDSEQRDTLLEALDSDEFAGNDALYKALPPSTSPSDPGFRSRSYWRGPVWPIINWLFWWSLSRCNADERARLMRDETLAEIRERGFAEYFEPFTGEPLGSDDQAWTAAVVLDWLLADGA